MFLLIVKHVPIKENLRFIIDFKNVSVSVMPTKFHLGKLKWVPARRQVIPGNVLVVRVCFVCAIDTVEIRVGTSVIPPSTLVMRYT